MPKPGGPHDPRPMLAKNLVARSCPEPGAITFPSFELVRVDACGETHELRCWDEPCLHGMTCCEDAGGGSALCHVPAYYSRTKRPRTVEHARAVSEAPLGAGRCN